MTLFPSTHYSLLTGLQDRSESLRHHALDRFVEIYWKPAYKYIRIRWRSDPAAAEDLTQSFFLALLERGTVAHFDEARGSFHNFLRVCIDNFGRDETKAGATARRGGDAKRLSLDFPGAEAELALAAAQPSPEELFHREWQRQIFSLAIADLESFCAQEGKTVQFDIFKSHDLTSGKPSYSALAAAHGLTVVQVTNYLHWSRRELRRLALERVAGVTGSAADLQTGTRLLFEL